MHTIQPRAATARRSRTKTARDERDRPLASADRLTRPPHWGERGWKGIFFLVLEQAGVVEENGIVRVPYRLGDGRLFRTRHFASSGRTWWGPGEGLALFGLERLPRPRLAAGRALILAEGESDALALREAFAGVSADSPVGGFDVLGLPGANTWRADWRIIVEPFPLIYVIGDGDEAGRRMIETVCRDVPWARPVWLPEGEDARSILQRDGARALDPQLEEADRQARFVAAFRQARTLAEFQALLTWGRIADAA